MCRLLLLLSFVINCCNHESRVTVSYVYVSYQFTSLFQSSEIFPWKSRVTVLYNGKSTMLILYHSFYLYSVWISALFCCSVQLRPLAGDRLWPQAEVVFLASSAAMLTYMSICLCMHWSYVNITWLSRSRSAAQLTERCLATSGLTRHECYHPLVLLAAMLTLLLAHSPPLSGCDIVYFLSQDCFGRSS